NLLNASIIKMNFQLKIGLMTGIYAVFMNILGALGSGLSVPISSIGNLGWREALAIWGILTVIALLIWLLQLRKSHKVTSEATEVEAKEKNNLLRSPLAWCVKLYMGGQSVGFYTLIA